MTISKEQTIGSVVAADFRTAAVFSKYKIDFCCNGGRTIGEACEKKKIVADELINELKTSTDARDQGSVKYSDWPADQLVEHIVSVHHAYVEEKIPVIRQLLRKLVTVHGTAHPELNEIEAHFTETSGNLAAHMKKEELILFPYINRMVAVNLTGETLALPPFMSVANPIAAMMGEHEEEGERLRIISELSDNYTVPADGCTTYRVVFKMLEEFEKDLHLHIHLENNILFPKAHAMESELLNLINAENHR